MKWQNDNTKFNIFKNIEYCNNFVVAFIILDNMTQLKEMVKKVEKYKIMMYNTESIIFYTNVKNWRD